MTTHITENKPICKCHGAEMKWSVDKRLEAGGHWRCKIKYLESNKRYAKSYKGRLNNQKRCKKYSNSIKGYIKKRKWQLNKSRELNLQKLEELQNVRRTIQS